ncbi:MAG: gst-2, partial [Bradyrhizobium sp.]|nr:gst-2 [Bradyrhizobium sp.]
MAGLDSAIHVFLSQAKQDVDARLKAGHDEQKRTGRRAVSMKRFTLYGSPHSLPTYRVALMLRLSGAPFSFRYVSYQKKMHRTPEFLALSRWGQVPVL